MSKIKKKTFRITENQIEWLQAESQKTGLNVVEIVRRALDAYALTEEAREQRRVFTAEQRRDIKIIARQHGISEIDVIRQTISNGLRRMSDKPVKVKMEE